MNRDVFKQILVDEKQLYLGDNPAKIKDMRKRKHKRYIIWRYMYYFRNWKFCSDLRQSSEAGRIDRKLAKHKAHYYEKKKNIFSYRSGVEIGANSTVGRNCDIWHSGVVINGTVGDNCVFHGNNTIGNKGKGSESVTPTLGNGVDVGVGAVIIGGVTIADDCVIGANSVVTKSFEMPGTVIAGVPGKVIN